MPGRPDAELLPSDVDELEAAIRQAEEQREACAREIKRLLAEEDPPRGIYHAAAIHDAKKQKMLLQYQVDLYVAKRNRLLLGDSF